MSAIPTDIRPAGPEDLEALLPLMASYYREDGYSFDPATARRAVAGLLADPALGGLWLVTANGRAVGYLAVTFGYSLEYGGRDAFLDEVYLLPEARGRGLGARLVALAEAACRAAGVRALHLEVEPDKRGAYGLYLDAGFVEHERRLTSKLLDERHASSPPDPEPSADS